MVLKLSEEKREYKKIKPLVKDIPIKTPKELELIQQWQCLSTVDRKLMEDKSFQYCKIAGLTSVQSYFYWAEIEKEQNKIDFSSYDELVEKLIKHNLRWVPFLILGPHYATPQWFQKSEESVYAKCLEHGKESKIQSIWNPFLSKWVDRFLQVVAEHYRDCDILKSITLGISGNWGEALYPVTGGFCRGFHTHPGWWCGDKYAVGDFQRFASEKYQSLSELNSTWETDFRETSDIGFPKIRSRSMFDLLQEINNAIPVMKKLYLSGIKRFLKQFIIKKPCQTEQNFNSSKYRYWLDFVEWYLQSMTDWAEYWVKTARKYFPDKKIYLVTGGNGNPILGADFSAQTRMVARYNSGIRITNQTDNYGESFILTRLVSTAARFYGTYFTTEEAGINSPSGITMRIFDAATSGAKGAYFKSIIGTGKDLCLGKDVPAGEPTQGAANLAGNLHYLDFSEPVIEIAFLLPNTSINCDFSVLDWIYSQCVKLRDLIDFDLVDENMIGDGVLKKYRFLLVVAGKTVSRQTLNRIEDWVKTGGILISSIHLEPFPAGNRSRITKEFFPQVEGIKKVERGFTLLLDNKKGNWLEIIKDILYNRENNYPFQGIPEIDGIPDGIYATRFSNKIIYYNSNNDRIRKKVEINNDLPNKRFEIDMKANSICWVNVCES